MLIILNLLLAFLRASGEECFDDGNEFCIDQDDILSVDLLPGSFLFADQYQSKNNSKIGEKETVDGTFDKALGEMGYHRKRMNEYLCHGYMAEEIVKEVSVPRVKRGPDSTPTNVMRDFLNDDNVTIHEKMLSDEGSSKYKNWLQRTTTLDDIYRHYSPHKVLKKKQGAQHDHNIEEFDGEVTGYAMQAPLPSGKIGVYEPPNENGDHVAAASGHHYHQYGGGFGHGEHFVHPGEFYPAIHEEHYYPAPYHHEHEHEEEHHKPVYHSKGKGHELSLKDFFEIALTALAFLAFGLFVIQLIMNATQTMPVTTAANTRDADGKRFKRNIGGLPLAYANNEELNELSFRVLRSVEAALVANMDSGNCLRRILCEDNQYSKATNDGRKIWIPVWSLGMSWISGRVSRAAPWSAMLDSVKASVLGLGGANCTSLYPDCDLRKEKIKRRRRRRK
ncbi:hypothetical protein KPH14_006394 [Odynerus spinipes]|uniref:Uncharacterized protein n=1 Tax=Odynerus spinipes TaxID=1348599 RepID=A0AAD9RZ73_9HYME|nr:hypothetical protein KPH14_006394 [Odynerus spinipes]